MRIIVADDDADGAEAMAMLLSMEGHEVRCTGDGGQALALTPEFNPHVLLVDLSMRGVTGIEVASALKSDPRRAHMLMIAVTGWGTDEKRAEALAAGFDHFCLKPTDVETVARLIADASAAGVFAD